MPPIEGEHGDFFTYDACPYFPCHEGVEPSEFNCMFCYCPLYALGPRCGGDFEYTPGGVKSCAKCTVMHEGRQGSRIVEQRFSELVDLAR